MTPSSSSSPAPTATPAPPARHAPPRHAASVSSACAPENSTTPSAAARTEQATDTWKTRYALRAGIEGTINQALDVTGLRHARYRGLPKTRLQHAFAATAVNVIRLDAHGNPDQPAFTPRASRLTRLSQQRTTRTAN
ncbi:transposase [Parafrankia discariae]|uniref:transposase n=1 Tax=Parafrankia discariae TaxID=365528 RepID=UPI001E36433F|nr:transposase [Parafrankia discariae]